MHRTTETAQKSLQVISTILHHSNLLPFTELLEKMNTFNAAVSRSASFLAEKSFIKHQKLSTRKWRVVLRM